MKRDYNWHSETARSTIHFLRHQSPNAAAALNQILDVYGVKAAYQASNAVMQLKTDIEKHGGASAIEEYECALLEFQDALPLFRRALRAFLIDFAMDVKNRGQSEPNLSGTRTQEDLPVC